MNESTPSPLGEADPKSLTALFAADPLSLSKQDFETIVLTLRANRAKFALEEQSKRRPKEAASDSLTLSDLGL